MKKSFVVTLVTLMMVVMVGSVALANSLTIGLSVPSLSMTWFSSLKEAVEERAAEMGVEVITIDARDQVGKQMSDIEDMIVQQVDGVLISPINEEALVPAIESLNEAGIPVVTIDRKVSGASTLAHVGADNVEAGRIAGRFIAYLLRGAGKVVELEGTPGSSPAIDRGSGFNEIIDQFPNIEVVARQSGLFTRADGMAVMENIIQAHPDIDAVFAHNDDMALGALEAIKASGIKMDEIVVIGVDAIEDALISTKNGELDATIEQFPSKQGSKGLEILVEYLQNGTKPESHDIYIEPALIVEGTLEKAENWARVKDEF